jgi:hypothetical protein
LFRLAGRTRLPLTDGAKPPMFKRKDRHSVLIGLNEHSVKLARMLQLEGKPLGIDSFAEVPANDEEAVVSWIRTHFPEQISGLLPAYATFYPGERLLMREVINTRRLLEPGYLPGLVQEQAKIPSAKEWQCGLVSATDGSTLTAESTQRAGLVIGVPWSAVRDLQQKLKRWGLRPRRLELGTITMLGGISRHMGTIADGHSVAACEIGQSQTRIYLIGKDGVHTPPALPHGLLSVEEAAMKELGAPDVEAARRQLEAQPEALLAHSRRLVRMLSRHLRPAIDYFEMQTGQRIGSLFCAHLPSRLHWLESALCSAVDLEPFPLELPLWLAASGLEAELAPGSPPGADWLQLFGVISQLAPAPTAGAAAPAGTTPPIPPHGPES